MAIEAMPSSAGEMTLAENSDALQRYSVLPDTLLKKRFGDAEKRRHYVNLELFGPGAIDRLAPDLHEMQRRFGARLMMRAGTLPWTIENLAGQLHAAWEAGDCGEALMYAGYLSHYVGDLSQPLHTTVNFDGPTLTDQGMHARIELAVDHSTHRLERLAQPDLRAEELKSPWDAIVSLLRQSNSLVPKFVEADRYARDVADGDRRAYRAALMRQLDTVTAKQLASSASLLASLWAYEWTQAGQPKSCSAEAR
jgi:Zinc dependent phospholipase C